MKRILAALLMVVFCAGFTGCSSFNRLSQSLDPPTPTPTLNEAGITPENWKKIIPGETTYDEVVALFGEEGDRFNTEEAGRETGFDEYTWENFPYDAVIDVNYNTRVVIRKWMRDLDTFEIQEEKIK